VDGLRKLGDLDALQDVYRALVEQLPAIVYIDDLDDDLTTLYVSPQIRELLGVEPADYCADPMIWNALLHDEDEERALEEYLRGRDTGEDFAFEYRMVGRNGRLVWFRDSVHVVKDERGNALLLQGVMLDITERKQAEEQVAFLAYHDKLTGLPNRALFGELLDLSLARARRHDLAVGVLYLDVDNFKLVNDSLGHTAGDDLLVQLADRLRGCTRETDLVARQGGDEFLLLLSDLERGTAALSGAADAPMLVAESVASRVQEALDAPFELNGQLHYVTVSSGISLFPQDAQSAEDLLKNADTAMYQSKRTAPGGYILFSPAGEDPAARLSLATRLRRAVEEKSWVLHYQPLVRLDDGVITGAEALIRWQDANGGIIPPGEFIPVAEEMGLIGAIGDWVIEELAAQQRRWHEAGIELEASFNLSPRQLWQSDLADRILTQLSQGGEGPLAVLVEITESTAMADPDRTMRVLNELHRKGLRLAIDDFGTGYSSLSRLKHMPVDVLKIDRSFVRGVDHDRDAAGMVQAMIQLARNLEMIPLAEGIETAGELEFLVETGCSYGQGFYLSRPVPAGDFERLWREGRGKVSPARPTAL
jgi:diguanylate cyclase (GGDEF)-like protein/PAS domain S-box-containing protein